MSESVKVTPWTLENGFFCDWRANNDIFIRLGLVLFRIGHWSRSWPKLLLPVAVLLRLAYYLYSRLVVVWEIPTSVRMGPAVTIRHGFALVINSRARIGAKCAFRQCVCIGNKGENDPAAPTIGDGVEFGCNSSVIGGVSVAQDATIGAGTVVVRDVPLSGSIVVGVPGRVIGRRADVGNAAASEQ